MISIHISIQVFSSFSLKVHHSLDPPPSIHIVTTPPPSLKELALPLPGPHIIQKLHIIDTPILIGIGIPNNIINLRAIDILQIRACQDLLELLVTYRPVLVDVEVLEHAGQVFLVVVETGLETGGDELVVVYFAVLVGVRGGQDLLQLVEGYRVLLGLESFLYLVRGQQPVVVLVHLLEDLAQFVDSALGHLGGDVCHHHLFHLCIRHKVLEKSWKIVSFA